MKTLAITAALAAAASMSGCASITDGTTQTITFKFQQHDAKCTLTRSGDELGTVSYRLPSVSVSKGARDIIAQCSAPGYVPKTLKLASSTQASGVVGGFFLDLGITDMITGAMWKYDGQINVSLDEEYVSSPSPRNSLAKIDAPASEAELPAGGTATAAEKKVGTWSWVAEHTSAAKSCSDQPTASLVAKSETAETLVVRCRDGQFITLVCENTGCKVFR